MKLNSCTIGQALRATAVAYGDRIALSDGDENITFAELDRVSDDIANGLVALGVTTGDHVAVWIANTPTWVKIWMACVKIGAVVVPVNTRLKREEVEYILLQSDAKVLLAMDSYWSTDYLGLVAEMVPEVLQSEPGKLRTAKFPALRSVICWKNTSIAGIQSLSQIVELGQSGRNTEAIEPDYPVIVVYTSGTTGYPKGAVHGHRLMIQASNVARSLHMEPGDVILGHMPFYHIAGIVSGILPMVMFGCTLVTMPHWIPEKALELMEQKAVTHFSGIPTHFIDCVDAQRQTPRNLSKLKSAWIGGAPVTPDVISAVRQELGVTHLQAIYGMTETSGATVISGYDDPPEVACDNMGKIVGDYDVKVVDLRTGESLPVGSVGEVWVRGHLVMQGYYKNKLGTDEVLDAEGWFHTGDLGAFNEEGYLRITGRAKEMFIVGGSNVYPAEVERVIQSHPAVKQAVVIAIPDARLGEVGRAYVQLSDGGTLSKEEMRAYCAARMADYKVPRQMVVVDDFPRTANGKIQRSLIV